MSEFLVGWTTWEWVIAVLLFLICLDLDSIRAHLRRNRRKP